MKPLRGVRANPAPVVEEPRDFFADLNAYQERVLLPPEDAERARAAREAQPDAMEPEATEPECGTQAREPECE